MNKCPLKKGPFSKENFIFQTSIFQEIFVSFQGVCIVNIDMRSDLSVGKECHKLTTGAGFCPSTV